MPPVVALQNARAVLTGALPKRSGGTLLHAAAADGSYAVLARLTRVLEESGGEAAVREAGRRRDAEGRTPLFVAAERGHALALALLMAAEDAPVDVRRSLQPRVRRLAWEIGAVGESALEVDAGNRATVTAEGNMHNSWPLSWWVVGLPAAAPSSGRWRYEVELRLRRIDRGVRRYYPPRTGSEWVGNSGAWGTTKEEARESLYEFPPTHTAACLTALSVGWSMLGATLPSFADEEKPSAWLFPALGVRGAKNGWAACGLWRDGGWRTTAEDQPEQTDVGVGPLPLQDGAVVVGLLLDVDTGEMHVAVGADAPWVCVQGAGGGLGGPLFPAVSCMGHTGSVRFNFGERPWQCDAPTPGVGAPWEGISAIAMGNTPLRAAVAAGHDDAALLLVPRTAREELDAADDRGVTLAHLAAKTGSAGVLRALSRGGANLDRKDADGDCSMSIATRDGRAECVAALVEGGADVNVQDEVRCGRPPHARLTVCA